MPLYLNTRGESNLGIYICQRCQTKRTYSQLCQDGNIPGFMVCRPSIRKGCFDNYDPMRLPPPPPDNLRLPFVRPDVALTVPAADAAQLPLQPPPQED